MRIPSSFAAAVLVTGLAVPASASGQAWLPLKGEGSLTAGVQLFHVNWHLERDGSRQEEVNVQVRNVIADFTYGLTDRIALSAGLPLVSSRFGELAHPCPDPVVSESGAYLYLPCAFPESAKIDNGKFYTTFQDLRTTVRFGLWNRHVTITPSIGVVLPVHSYEVHGHAAPGRHLRELALGVHAGRSLGPRLPDTYVHASYVFSLSQHLEHHDLDLSLNRSNMEFEVGHQLASRLAVQGVLLFQRMHGGLEWVDELFAPGSVHEEIHDQAAKASYRRASLGFSCSVNDRVDVSVSFLHTMAGRNSHQVDGVHIGTTWRFGLSDGIIGGK